MFKKSKSRDPESEEARLAQAFRNGEEWAFSEVYRRQRRSILHFLLPRVRDRETALDLLQEVFLKAHRFCASYRTEYPIASWIRAIARNTLTDWFRTHRFGSLSAPEDDAPARLNEAPTDPTELLVSPDPNPEKLLARQGERRRLKALFKRLSQAQRRVVWMRWIQDRSYAEIARALGLSLDAVKCLAYRSRLALTRAENRRLTAP